MKTSNLSRIAAAVYGEPWLVLASQHALIRSIVDAHVTGQAHVDGGLLAAFRAQERDDDEADKSKCAPRYEMDGTTAIIPIHGTLGQRVGMLEEMSGMTDYLRVRALLSQAASDSAVESVVLAIDSPGGTCVGCSETGEAVARVGKPVVAYTDGGMNSAAYWIGAQADMIVASESSIVGSIGVYSYLLDVSRAYENAGAEALLFRSGKFKGLGAEGVPVSDEQRDMLQAQVDAIFADFRDAVLANRPDVPAEAMQGQTFRTSSALAAGLIDEVGGLDVAVIRAQEMAGAYKKG